MPPWASKSWDPGCPAEGVGAGQPWGEDGDGDGDEDEACQGLHTALGADHHDPELVVSLKGNAESGPSHWTGAGGRLTARRMGDCLWSTQKQRQKIGLSKTALKYNEEKHSGKDSPF